MLIDKAAVYFTKRKNLILIIYCLLLLMLVVLLTNFYKAFIHQTLYDGGAAKITAITDQGTKSLDAVLGGHLRHIVAFKSYLEDGNIDFTTQGSEEQTQHLKSFLKSSEYLNLCVAYKAGEALCYDGSIMKINMQQCFDYSLNGSSCIFVPNTRNHTGKTVAVTIPMNYENGKNGVLLATSSLQAFFEGFKMDFGDFLHSYVLDKNGNVLVNYADDEHGVKFDNLFLYLSQNNNNEELVDVIRNDLADNITGVRLISAEGVNKFISYKPFRSSHSSFYLVAVISESRILKYENRILFYTTILFIIGGIGVACIFFYIAVTRRSQRKKTFRLAYFDTVTTLYNRNYLEDFCKRLILEKNAEYAAVSLDINHFKVFNHLYGREQGVFILKVIGDAVKEALQQGEIAARVAGDIFCLMLKYEKQSDLVIRMSKITETVKINLKTNPNLINNRITFACGIFLTPEDEVDPNKVLDNADIARKTAKTSGKSWITFFRKTMINSLKSEQAIEDIMELALKNEEFVVYFQPKVDLSTMKIMGAEALVRWIRPDHGIVSPAAFIPIFERTGFITQLDFYVFERTCKILHQWRSEGMMEDVVISVNMSRNHLDQEYFVDVLALIAARWEIPLSSIEIEITESDFSGNSEHLIQILNNIKAEGFRLSMDDFGSGYSSLNLLQSIPIDVLKIDKEFLNRSDVSEKSRVIIACIIHMAKSIEMKVICEGVETEAQAAFLHKVGCDYVQGYLFAKPMPVKDFYNFIKKVNADGGIKLKLN